MSVQYAYTQTANVATSWKTYIMDHSGLTAAASGGLNTAAGTTGLLTVVPQPTLDTFTLLQAFASGNALGSWPPNTALDPTVVIAGNATAMYVRVSFLFDLTP
jgi:hypothetical protein